MPALHGLRQDLLCGRLESALRQISSDGQETWSLLEPSDWRQWRLQLLRTFQSKVEIKVIPIDKDEAVDEHEYCFFVRRADLDKRYPARPLALATTSERRTDDRRRKPGPKTKHEWKRHVAAEVHRIKESGKSTPSASELAQYCYNKWKWQPDESDIQKLLRSLLNE